MILSAKTGEIPIFHICVHTCTATSEVHGDKKWVALILNFYVTCNVSLMHVLYGPLAELSETRINAFELLPPCKQIIEYSAAQSNRLCI